jgi:hypothetical protein
MISLILIDVQQLDSVTSMVNDCPIGYDGKDCELCANGFVEKRNAHENRKCIACVANGPLAIVGAIFGFIIIAGLAAWLSDLRLVREMSIPLRNGNHSYISHLFNVLNQCLASK